MTADVLKGVSDRAIQEVETGTRSKDLGRRDETRRAKLPTEDGGTGEVDQPRSRGTSDHGRQ